MLSKSRSVTCLVCPFNVRSNSPVSQSQILTVASMLADASKLNVGWKATFVISPRWPVSVYDAGALGTQSVCKAARLAGAKDSSSCREAFRFSRSIIYDNKLVRGHVIQGRNLTIGGRTRLLLQPDHTGPLFLEQTTISRLCIRRVVDSSFRLQCVIRFGKVICM